MKNEREISAQEGLTDEIYNNEKNREKGYVYDRFQSLWACLKCDYEVYLAENIPLLENHIKLHHGGN